MTDNHSGSRSVEAPPEAGRLGGHATDNQEYWYDLIEKDDRTSPEEYPDMALITRDELFTYLDQARAEPVRHGVDSVDSSVSREATGRQGQYEDDLIPPECDPSCILPDCPYIHEWTRKRIESFTATIKSISHNEHRYSTVGDWQFRDAPVGCTYIDIQVSATPDWRHAALIAVHELIEAILCRHRGISQDEVDSFDLSHSELAEPGLSENCPYRREHLHAHHVEVNLAYELGVDWQEYTAALDILDSLDD